MNIISVLVLGCLVGADGFFVSPRRTIKSTCIEKQILKKVVGGAVKKNIIKKSIIKKRKKNLLKKALLPAVVGGAVVGGAAVTGAAAIGVVAISQLNNGEVFQPLPGSMIDETVLITGGSSGLGLETAKRLGAAGATVVLTSRTEDKGNIAVDSVKDYLIGKGVDTSKIFSLVLDLDSLDNVKQFATSYNELELGDISVLINNAGCMAIPNRELTIDGNERQFQSNHLGHFLLTAELFPYFSRDGTKVINVSSSASNIPGPNGLDMDNLNSEKIYSAWGTYGTTKLANVLFTNELRKKANDAGLDWLTTVSLHPGVVNTDLWRYIVGEEKLADIKSQDTPSLESLALSATSLFTKSPEQGASTQIYLAATDDLVKGAFYEEMKEKTNMPTFAKDEVKASELWNISKKLAGIKFDLTMSTDDIEFESGEIDIDSDVLDAADAEEDTSKVTDAQKRFFGLDEDDA